MFDNLKSINYKSKQLFLNKITVSTIYKVLITRLLLDNILTTESQGELLGIALLRG